MPNPVPGLWFSAKLETVQPSRSSRSGGDGLRSDGGTDALCPGTQETQQARRCLRIEKPSRHEETCIPQAVRARPPQRAHLCGGPPEVPGGRCPLCRQKGKPSHQLQPGSQSGEKRASARVRQPGLQPHQHPALSSWDVRTAKRNRGVESGHPKASRACLGKDRRRIV